MQVRGLSLPMYDVMNIPEEERCIGCEGTGEVPWHHTFGEGYEHRGCSACGGSGHIADYYHHMLLYEPGMYSIIAHIPKDVWRKEAWKLGRALYVATRLVRDFRRLVPELDKEAAKLAGYEGSKMQAFAKSLMKDSPLPHKG